MRDLLRLIEALEPAFGGAKDGWDGDGAVGLPVVLFTDVVRRAAFERRFPARGWYTKSIDFCHATARTPDGQPRGRAGQRFDPPLHGHALGGDGLPAPSQALRGRIQSHSYCPVCNVMVPREELVRSFEFAKDEYVASPTSS
jgi:hypothetical protein